ncbi:YqgE/AlgH family protein [Amorphus coralli]|uniref:YqgE/AlgH family protein n=1 Tax=Amorphus coralli TaxID=340680 RepID=UPI0003799D6C|nr:YqgE/AlgH family protein [Amorphus coralli]
MSATNMDGYLEGQLLVAMPTMGDTRFERAVIFMCAHSDEGAMGIVLNQPAEEVSFSDLLVQLDIVPEGEPIRLAVPEDNLPVHKGGPVETGRGFVLHSGDYFISDSTLAIDSDICLTATVEILKAIAEGRGPRRALLALGYAGWAPGQLEAEIQRNGWLTCPADPRIVFEPDLDEKYDLALKKMGIDPRLLSGQAGTA